MGRVSLCYTIEGTAITLPRQQHTSDSRQQDEVEDRAGARLGAGVAARPADEGAVDGAEVAVLVPTQEESTFAGCRGGPPGGRGGDVAPNVASVAIEVEENEGSFSESSSERVATILRRRELLRTESLQEPETGEEFGPVPIEDSPRNHGDRRTGEQAFQSAEEDGDADDSISIVPGAGKVDDGHNVSDISLGSSEDEQ